MDVLFGLELLNKLNNGNDGTCRCLLKYSSVKLYLNFAVSASYPKIRLIRDKRTFYIRFAMDCYITLSFDRTVILTITTIKIFSLPPLCVGSQ